MMKGVDQRSPAKAMSKIIQMGNFEAKGMNGLQNMEIVGLEQIENNLPAEEYFHEELKVDKLGYVFKKDDGIADGPEYDRVCPLCSQFVIDGSYYLVYNCKQLKRKFMSHYQCLLSADSQKFRFIEIPEQIDEAILRHQPPQVQRKRSIEVSQSYYATITLSHPISNAVYMQLDKNIINWNNDELQWSFGNQEPLLYLPNFVCVPYMDFKCTISVDYKKFIKKHEFLINLNRRQSRKKNTVQAQTSNITLQMEIFTTPAQKQAIVSEMNFIYPFTKNFILVKFNSVKIKIPEELEDLQIFTSQKKLKSQPMTSTASFSSPTLHRNTDYICNNNVNEQVNYYSRIIPQQQHMYQYMMQQQSPMTPNQQNLECYYNDIDEIIQSGRIKEYVQTSNGSRQFQKYLKKCSYDEVEQILNTCHNDFAGFITHDYANYMFQGLVNSCSPQQRIKVVNKIAPQLSVLSQNKKGTHSLQTLITVITTAQQAHIVCKALQTDFIMLCENANATHLIQKIIQTFEAIYLSDIFNLLLKQFIRLCKNAFGICVLKAFMKKVQNNKQTVNNIVKNISQNLDVIIQDPYGNYIVQYSFEMFGKDRCQEITTQIINKFTQYCIQKFSANVVEKCIVTYCPNIHGKAIASIIQANSLQQLLKTPTGNSILLKLVKQHPNKDIQQKIRKILSLPRMSKYSNNWDSHFYNSNQKAATCKNIHGQTFNNFSQAAQMARGGGKPKKGSFTPKDKKY